MLKRTILATLMCTSDVPETLAQADNEIQVYASPTIQKRWTIFELHSNYTFKGSNYLTDQKGARWINETLEITHGVGKNFEIGFYTFTGVNPYGGFQYLGNQVRPRISMPTDWNWPVGLSLSVEFGFFRPSADSAFFWQGEIRPIIDKTINNWYFAFNPNFDFVITGANKGFGCSPQAKLVYTVNKKYGFGFEYYSGLGNIDALLPVDQQEHLAGPMFDLYTNPRLELNTGFLWGLTPNSNQQIFKLLLGWRVEKN